MLKNFVDIITALKPTWFIMENVEGLITANHGNFLIEAIIHFLTSGYWVKAKKVYLETYGIPQKRKRVIIVGNDEFELQGSWASVAAQIGNAIPPFFMEILMRHIQHLATWHRISDQKGRWFGINATKSAGKSPHTDESVSGTGGELDSLLRKHGSAANVL